MRLLLDTHTFLWFVLNDAKLSSTALALLRDPNNILFLSPASYWEIAIKISTGKYFLPEPFEIFMLREVDGLNTAETAECLGVSEDVLKTRLSRGRAALRHQLAERAGIHAPETFRFPQTRCDRIVAAMFARIA